MEDLLGGIPGASGLGAIAGFIGSFAGRVVGIFETKMKIKERALERTHEIALIDKQLEASAAETEQEISLKNVEGGWKGFAASHASDAATGQTYRWVNAAKALVRVVMTPLLWVMTGVLMFMLTRSDLQAYMSSEEVSYLVAYIVKSVVFAASTATAWWFGDRAPKPRGL